MKDYNFLIKSFCEKLEKTTIGLYLECAPILVNSSNDYNIYTLEEIEIVDSVVLLRGGSCFDNITLRCCELPNSQLEEIYNWLVDNEEDIKSENE